MIYLHLSSRDSLNYHPGNVWHDFTVELPDLIEGKFSAALVDFATTDTNQETLNEELYVFSDILENSFVLDHQLPLMRIVAQFGEVTLPHYKTVSREFLQRIKIYIKNRQLEAPANSIQSVRVTFALLPLRRQH